MKSRKFGNLANQPIDTMKIISITIALTGLILSATSAHAETHTWIPRTTIQGSGSGDLQTVVVTGGNPYDD
jgi:hypothetical protein